MHYFRITLLAAAMVAFNLTPAFPAFTDEPVGTDVTVAKAGTSDTFEDSVQDVTQDIQESQETSGSRESRGHRASVVDEEEYISQGPGVQKEEKEEAPVPRGTLLRWFAITGYCGCEQCSGGCSLTYSGTAPTPSHTISADSNYFPLGTKPKIDGTVYTVENEGSFINGNTLDIYYGSHQEALAKGTYTAGVFLVQG